MTAKASRLYRQRHAAEVQAQKKAYYRATAQVARNNGKEWTTAELDAITAADRPSDRVLAARLGRSMQAIQVKRSLLRGKDN